MAGEFTGKHMAVVMCAGFGIVIAVNLTMAAFATSTFGGVVVENSYVASQKFNGWLDAAERGRDLGWNVEAVRGASGAVVLKTAGVPGEAVVQGVARHPLGLEPERALKFMNAGDGSFVSRESLPQGRCTLRLDLRAGSEHWRGERDVQ
jgi:nitrogen fixation protein FixH